MSEVDQVIKLRKQGEKETIGPMDMGELRELARSAYVGPMDELSMDGKHWVLAKDLKELEMHWLVWNGTEAVYGPTTLGTLSEFLLVGEIAPDQIIRHAVTGEEKTLRELIGDAAISDIQSQAVQQQEASSTDPDLEESMEVAREIRIQHLETELEKVKKDYDSLMLQFRRTSEELLKTKGGR